jgi:hypothetical protein
MMLLVSPTFFLTHDDHLPHNTFASVARRCFDRLQLGMSDFLRRNPHLGGMKSLTGVRTLFAGSSRSGIYFPQHVGVEYSRDGGDSWLSLGIPSGQNVGIDTPLLYSVGWVNATNWKPVIASKVRVTANFRQWLFIGEINVMGL